jgi:hypothetical protein
MSGWSAATLAGTAAAVHDAGTVFTVSDPAGRY